MIVAPEIYAKCWDFMFRYHDSSAEMFVWMDTLPLDCAREISRLLSGGAAYFYRSDSWLDVRYKALLQHGRTCHCCGSAASPDNPIHVDHIKPRSEYPELALDIANLQILCRACNFGKRAWDQTDWRTRSAGG